MKRIYMFQMNIPYPNGTYLPYAAGTVAAYALSDPFLKERYALEDKIIKFYPQDIAPTGRRCVFLLRLEL